MLSRRMFAIAGGCALAFAVTACATVGESGASGAAAVTGGHVALAAAGGTADALLYRPEGEGRWPAIVVWTDGSGLRPAYVALGRRLAGEGYVVLIPNAYYRSIKLDGSGAAPALDPAQARERGTQWRTAANEEAILADARAYMSFLDVQPGVDTGRKAAVLGFDYGSANAFYAARAVPGRIGAVAAIYPSGTATPRPNSPHLFVAQSRAVYYVALSQDDDAREPGDKDDYRKAFTDAGLSGEVEVVPANHGFAIEGERAFDPAAAEAALGRALALFGARLR